MGRLTLADFSAVIFDMDGLVLDTEPTYSKAWQLAAYEMGIELTECFCLSLSGRNYQDIQQSLIDQCGVDFDLDYFSLLSGNIWREQVSQHGIPIKKGVLESVAFLKANKIPFCIATNSSAVNAQECLKFAQIEDIFSLVLTLDQVEKGKPAPDIFLLAAQKMGVPIECCLVLEDSHTGVVAAVDSGALSVFIPSVFPVDFTTVGLASYFVSDLTEWLNAF